MNENRAAPLPERPRYVPDEPFPPYAFVPGQQPHPHSDPRGHSHGRPEATPSPPDAGRWFACRAYLRGIDLFNHGYYWEAHEAWEGLWHACPRLGPETAFFQGLIHLAAAGVKVREGKPAGVVSHATRAEEHFRRLASSLGPTVQTYFGLSLAGLVSCAKEVAERSEEWSPQRGLPVAVVLPFELRPSSEFQVVQVPDSEAHRCDDGR